MRPTSILSLFALSAAAADVVFVTVDTAIIARNIQPHPVNCNVVTGVLALLKGLGGPATSFCSSYLHIGASTTTKFITPATSTVVVPSTVVSVSTVSQFVARKRAAPMERRVLPGLAAYAAAEITSACACLQLPSKVVTATVTVATPLTTSFSLTTTVSVTTCAAPGAPCECGNPGACCNQACQCGNGQIPVSTCL